MYPKNMSNSSATDLTILNTLENWYNLPAEEQIGFRNFCHDTGLMEYDYNAINNLKRMADCHSEPMQFVQNQTSISLAKLVLTPDTMEKQKQSSDKDSDDKETEEDSDDEETEEDSDDEEKEEVSNEDKGQEKELIQDIDCLTTNTIVEPGTNKPSNNDLSELLLIFFLFTVSLPLFLYNLHLLIASFRPAN